MDHKEEILNQLETAAHRAYLRGIQTGSGGNLSARITDKKLMIVKSSGGSFIDCKKNGDGFVVTDFYGNIQEVTSQTPTRESFLHGLLYQLREDINGVMHCHSPWSITWSFKNKTLPMITQHLKLKITMPIPILNIDSPMVRLEDRPAISNLFDDYPNLPAFILRGHGVVALGKDILDAEHIAELVEETAQIAVFSKLLENIL